MGELIGGLFGGGAKKPAVTTPAPVSDAPRTNVDPNRSEGVAEARRRRLSLSKRTGRSALRTDLDQSSGTSRSGISITQ